jgi:hypothetical protein
MRLPSSRGVGNLNPGLRPIVFTRALSGEFLYELLAFPHGRHDDQVDSVSQFLRWWQISAYAKPMSWAGPIIISRPRNFP